MALATIIRSPKSWETSLRYGVSPQPLQASENSNSGSRTWAPLTVSWAIRLRSSGGIDWKNSQFGPLGVAVRSAAGSMLIDLCLTSVLLLAGQTSTQTPQPVQSSGATWIVSRWSTRSRDLNSLELEAAGAPSTASAGKTFIRIAACGQTMAHLPQSMQIDGSQIGSSRAIARFSNCVVPDREGPVDRERA